MNDNHKQLIVLLRFAIANGYSDIDGWAMSDIDNFMSVSESWRIIENKLM